MQVLSPDFSRYLSRTITILPDAAQDHNHAHGTCAAGLPGICDVNLVCHTTGDDISASARCYSQKGTTGTLLNLTFLVQNSLVPPPGSLGLYLAKVNPAGTYLSSSLRDAVYLVYCQINAGRGFGSTNARRPVPSSPQHAC